MVDFLLEKLDIIFVNFLFYWYLLTNKNYYFGDLFIVAKS
jgi:hypothetical protein